MNDKFKNSGTYSVARSLTDQGSGVFAILSPGRESRSRQARRDVRGRRNQPQFTNLLATERARAQLVKATTSSSKPSPRQKKLIRKLALSESASAVGSVTGFGDTQGSVYPLARGMGDGAGLDLSVTYTPRKSRLHSPPHGRVTVRPSRPTPTTLPHIVHTPPLPGSNRHEAMSFLDQTAVGKYGGAARSIKEPSPVHLQEAPPVYTERKPLRTGHISEDVAQLLDKQYSTITAATLCQSSRGRGFGSMPTGGESMHHTPKKPQEDPLKSSGVTVLTHLLLEKERNTSKFFGKHRTPLGQQPRSPFLLSARDVGKTRFLVSKVDSEIELHRESADVRRTSTVSLGTSQVLERTLRITALNPGDHVDTQEGDIPNLPSDIGDGAGDGDGGGEEEEEADTGGDTEDTSSISISGDTTAATGDSIPEGEQEAGALVASAGITSAVEIATDVVSSVLDQVGVDAAEERTSTAIVSDMISGILEQVLVSATVTQEPTSALSIVTSPVLTLVAQVIATVISFQHAKARTVAGHAVDSIFEDAWSRVELAPAAQRRAHPVLDAPASPGMQREVSARSIDLRRTTISELQSRLSRSQETGKDDQDTLTEKVKEKLRSVMLPAQKIFLSPEDLRESYGNDLRTLEIDHGHQLVSTLLCMLYFTEDLHTADLDPLMEQVHWQEPPRSSFTTVLRSSAAMFKESERETWELFHPALYIVVRQRYLTLCPRECDIDHHLCEHVATSFRSPDWAEKDGAIHAIVAKFYEHELEVRTMGQRRRARALAHYPRHLMLSESSASPTFIPACRLLTNIDFLVEKASACGFDSLFADFDLALAVYLDPGPLAEYRRLLRTHEARIKEDPSALVDITWPRVNIDSLDREGGNAQWDDSEATGKDTNAPASASGTGSPELNVVERVNTVAKKVDVDSGSQGNLDVTHQVPDDATGNQGEGSDSDSIGGQSDGDGDGDGDGGDGDGGDDDGEEVGSRAHRATTTSTTTSHEHHADFAGGPVVDKSDGPTIEPVTRAPSSIGGWNDSDK